MRRLSVLLGIAAVSLGCSDSPDDPETPSEDPVKNEGVLYLEKPLDYWVGQATSADPPGSDPFSTISGSSASPRMTDILPLLE